MRFRGLPSRVSVHAHSNRGGGLPLSVPVAASASPSDQAAAAIGKTQAKKLAKAGVLTKADLPGYSAEAQTEDAGDVADEKAYFKCLGAKYPAFLARNLGYTYTKGELNIDSSADVASSVSTAKADLKAIKSSKAPACYKKGIVAFLKRSGFTVKSASVERSAVTVKGADGATAFHIRAEILLGDMAFKLDGYDVSVLVGQTEITVSPGRLDGKEPSLKQSVALAEKVAKRVRAA